MINTWDKSTWREKILAALLEMGRPSTGKEILEVISKHGGVYNSSGRVMITFAVRDLVIFRLKYPKMPSFYLHPHWTNEHGKLNDKYEFKPYTKEFTLKEINEKTETATNQPA